MDIVSVRKFKGLQTSDRSPLDDLDLAGKILKTDPDLYQYDLQQSTFPGLDMYDTHPAQGREGSTRRLI